MSTASDLRVPFWCPQCRGLMKGKSTNTWYDYKVCIQCFIEFIEGREQRWNEGWRPSQDSIDSMKERNNKKRT